MTEDTPEPQQPQDAAQKQDAKITVDEGWKEQAQAEKERLAAEEASAASQAAQTPGAQVFNFKAVHLKGGRPEKGKTIDMFQSGATCDVGIEVLE